jgi:hypothetical protein
MPDLIDTYLRENRRYTGDGLPNAPVGAPAPYGDPASGVHNPLKSQLREILHWIIPQWVAGDGILEFDVTTNVPSDFLTMQEALDFYSRYRAKQGVRIVINIESGHQPATGLLVQNGDFSHFWIESTDAVVTLHSTFDGVDTPDGASDNTSNGFITGINAKMPVLATIIDADGRAKNGYMAYAKSEGWINRPPHAGGDSMPSDAPTAGIKNCTSFNIRSREGSTVYAENVVATGAGTNGVYANRGSTIHAMWTDASDAGQFGFCANRFSTIVADLAIADDCEVGFFALVGGHINAIDAHATACGIGFYASQTATINCQSAIADGAIDLGDADQRGSGFVSLRGSVINALGASAENCAAYGFYAEDCAEIVATNASADGALGGAGFFARGSSKISAQAASAVGTTGNGFEAANGSTINARLATATGCGGSGVFATSNSTVNAELAVLTTATTHAVYATKGSNINAFGASLHTAGGFEVRVDHGSFIAVSTATTRSVAPGVPNAADTSVGAFNTLAGTGAVFNNT